MVFFVVDERSDEWWLTIGLEAAGAVSGSAPPPRCYMRGARPGTLRLEPCWDSLGTASLPFGRGSPFCAAWPAVNATGETDENGRSAALAALVDRLIAPHGRVPEGRLRSLLRLPCVQRFCLRLQILSGKLYVIAPEAKQCGTTRAGNCSRAFRQRLQGLAMTGANPVVGKWSPDWSPTPLEWHFIAGINVSDCGRAIIPGDVNGPFTRIRLVTALRLIAEAADAGGLPDTELVLCAGETPLNAGGWCLPGTPQPCVAISHPPPATSRRFPRNYPTASRRPGLCQRAGFLVQRVMTPHLCCPSRTGFPGSVM